MEQMSGRDKLILALLVGMIGFDVRAILDVNKLERRLSATKEYE
jgi:hypothetical protein